MPFGNEGGSIIKRINIFHTNLTALEVKKNGVLIWDNISPALLSFLETEYKCVPQAGLYVYDPTMQHNIGSDVLVTADAAAMEVNPTLSAADTLAFYIEYLDNIGNL